MLLIIRQFIVTHSSLNLNKMNINILLVAFVCLLIFGQSIKIVVWTMQIRKNCLFFFETDANQSKLISIKPLKYFDDHEAFVSKCFI